MKNYKIFLFVTSNKISCDNGDRIPKRGLAIVFGIRWVREPPSDYVAPKLGGKKHSDPQKASGSTSGAKQTGNCMQKLHANPRVEINDGVYLVLRSKVRGVARWGEPILRLSSNGNCLSHSNLEGCVIVAHVIERLNDFLEILAKKKGVLFVLE